MVLLGARPGQGKTLMGLELAVEAMKAGRRGSFFTLEYTEKEVLDRFRAIGTERQQFGALFELDSSDTINAGHIARRMATPPRGTVVVVDYLQLLDQKRDSPELMEQVRALRALARDKGLIVVMISQIDRSYDPSAKAVPDLDDVRLPNPLDLKLFDKACFLNQGEVRFHAV
jgi:replicative DNA helicase